ncbi:MAG: cytochrome c-type biogenesis CcmF C-terminal domain-containing protein [Pseudomonadota bacterium]
MIAELGHFALILLLALGCAQAVLFCPVRMAFFRPVKLVSEHGEILAQLSPEKGNAGFEADKGQPARLLWPLPVMICLLAFMAQGTLIYSFVISDFSLPLVADYSHSSTPLFYRISAAITPENCAILLWISLTALASVLFWAQSRLSPRIQNADTTLAGLGLIIALLAASAIIDGNPFLRDPVPPLDGMGLDPLTQDVLTLIHAPLLYAGLAALSVIFTTTFAALPRAQLDRIWARQMGPWAVSAWLFLGAAILTGTYRSYIEQGWGQWWYWDVTENAVLLPWILATALLHCLTALEKTEALKPWTALLALSAFGAGWFGMFLVRSDWLGPLPAALIATGEHATLLIGFCIMMGGAYFLFSRTAGQLREAADFSFLSRESGLFINSVLFAVAAAIILTGTVYPLIVRWIGDSIVTVGPPFFVQALLPVVVPILLVMGLAPSLRWRQDRAFSLAGRLKLPLIMSAVITLFVWMRHINASPLPLLGIGLAAWIVTASIADLWERLRRNRDQSGTKYRNIARLGPHYTGMTLAHIGMGLLVAGASASTLWQEEIVLSARSGQSIEIGPYNLQYEGVALLPGENYATRKATFILYQNAQPLGQLSPEVRYYPVRGVETIEADVWHSRDGDLHVTVGERAEDGGRIVNIRFFPMMSWVWAGMIIILIGGIMSVFMRALLFFKKNEGPTQ